MDGDADAHDDGRDADARFRIHSRLELIGFLRGVVERHEPVGVEFGSADFVVSALLDVDPERNRIVCDYAADAGAMTRLLRASELRFATHLDSIGIRFASGRAAPTSYTGAPAFTVPIPDSILRIQRREGYRLRIPLGRPLHCEVADPNAPEHKLMLRVRDISVCGLSLMAIPPSVKVEGGTIFRNCTIALPESLGIVHVDIEVMQAPVSLGGRCGCRFVAPGMTVSTQIQRYITRMEREINAKQ
ncbi:MAG TPA: flagellar brake protein [Casimicrobiaceae bacterium]|nr:flagellar brake protein [Casimicrobiaceae bacterium]